MLNRTFKNEIEYCKNLYKVFFKQKKNLNGSDSSKNVEKKISFREKKIKKVIETCIRDLSNLHNGVSSFPKKSIRYKYFR